MLSEPILETCKDETVEIERLEFSITHGLPHGVGKGPDICLRGKKKKKRSDIHYSVLPRAASATLLLA